MEWYRLDSEELKILCETMKKILYGIAFDSLPSVRILQCIEDGIGANLEFKYGFRYLVPQVYGWEFLPKLIDNQRFENERRLEKAENDAERRLIQESCWLDEERLKELRPDYDGPVYFNLHLDTLRIEDRKTYENYRDHLHNMKAAEQVFESLYKNLDELESEIKEAEEYRKIRERREDVLETIEYQCGMLYKFNYDPPYGIVDLHEILKEFVNNIIENRCIPCTDKLSGDDSGLSNFWEEFCVQVQQEHSFFWRSYLDTLSMWIYEELKKLPKWKQNAIGVIYERNKIESNSSLSCDITDSEYSYLDDIDVDKINVVKESYLIDCYTDDFITEEIMGVAVDYSNKAIDNYIDGSYEYD